MNILTKSRLRTPDDIVLEDVSYCAIRGQGCDMYEDWGYSKDVTLQNAIDRTDSAYDADLFVLRGKYPVLDLRHRDLSSADLSDADFADADFTGTDFTGSKLVGQSFSSSVLADTNFTRCDLRRAYFEDVDLRKAILNGADLRDATFINCILPFGFRPAGATVTTLRGVISERAGMALGECK